MGRKKNGEDHHHDFAFVQWQGLSHIHAYSTRTTVNDRHSHIVQGITSAPVNAMNGHVHYYEGVTTYDDRHVHRFNGYTGPAILLPDGSHYHEFGGQTTYDDGHIHYYRGRTGIAQAAR